MNATQSPPRLEVSDLEFVPARLYQAIHGCGTRIVGPGGLMRDALDAHTAACEWTEPTA